jgi:transposase-like protein
MKRTRDGRRRFTRDFKIAAVRRVLEGEDLGSVARDLEIGFELLWRWKKRVVEEGEEHLYDVALPRDLATFSVENAASCGLTRFDGGNASHGRLDGILPAVL